MNMGLSGIEKRFGRHFSSGMFYTGAESGTCNMCASPCSSCMHCNQMPVLMGSKSDESSVEACQGKKASRCSPVDADLLSPFKSSSCNKRQRTSSETSNLVNPCSSHDSFSENAESKATLNVSDTSVEVEMCVKCEKPKDSQCNIESLQGTAVFSNKSDPSEISSLRDVYACNSLPKGEHSECSTEHVESSLARAENFSVVGLRHNAHNCAESVKIKTEMGDGDPTVEAVKFLKQNEYLENLCVSLELPNLQEPPLQFQAVDNSDGSDIVEHDVKVCDICGDAGREDLLAICSRCSDGAEHTYCMCIKLEKVPEGDWMCEECMLREKSEKQKQDDFEKAVGTSSGSSLLEISQNCQNSSTSRCKNALKLDIKDLSCQKSGTNKASLNSHPSAKRAVSNLVTASVKRRAFETSVGSPTAGPCKKLLLARDSSFKNLCEGKLKRHHKSSPCDHSSANILENAHINAVRHNSPKSHLQLEMSQGSLFKSNSFNTIDSRMKIQQPEPYVRQKQKFSREIVTSDQKMEGAVRVMSKSMSFGGATSDGSNASNPRVQMLSSSFSHVEVSKRLQNAKDQHLVRRKNSFRSDNPMVTSPVAAGSGVSASKSVKRVASKTDLEAVQCHQNSNNSSNPTSHLAQECSKCPNDLAESDGAKRQSSCSSNLIRDPSFTSMSDSSCELKPNKMNLSSNVKDVAEATTTRRHELHIYHRFPNQVDELATSSTNLDCQVASKDWLLTYSGCVSTDGTNEGQDRAVDDVRQHVEHPNAIDAQNSNAAGPSEKRPYMRGLPRFSTAVAVSSRITAVPELDYIWRGGFEIQRSGRLPRFCNGIQAHLSTCASLKVLDAVNKFPHKVLLEEVSRLETWPTQFLENCATEDNIALYFFAEDLESYVRNYKILLECMIEHDLALRGYVDGIELLIFSSNLLPEKSQHWNKLSFLWGVFRGRRVTLSEHKPNSQKTICIPDLNALPSDQDLFVPATSVSQKMFFPRQLGESLSAPHMCYNAQRASNSVTQVELPSISSGRMNQICESDLSSPEQKYVGFQTNFDLQPSRVGPVQLSSIPKKNEQLYKEMRDNDTSLNEYRDPDRGHEVRRECDIDYVTVGEESECRRMKSSFSGIYASNSSRGVNNSGKRFPSGLGCFHPSFPIDDYSNYRSCDMVITSNSRVTGRSLFSADPSPVGGSLGVKFTQGLSSDDRYQMESRVPNLELSLGAESKLGKQAIMPSFLGTVDKKKNQGEQPNPVTNSKNNEDELSASLSLFLALSSSNKEPNIKGHLKS